MPGSMLPDVEGFVEASPSISRRGSSAFLAPGPARGSRRARSWHSPGERSRRRASVSPRTPGSMPALSIVAASHTADTAFRSVLRRCENAAATRRENNAKSSIRGARSRNGRSRATAESTFGTGRNAPGGTMNKRSTSKRTCSITVSRP